MASVSPNENAAAAVLSLSEEDLNSALEAFILVSDETQNNVLEVLNAFEGAVIETQENGAIVVEATNADGVVQMVTFGDATIDLSAKEGPVAVGLAEGNQTVEAGAGDSIAFTTGGQKTLGGVTEGVRLDFSTFEFGSLEALVASVVDVTYSDVDADGTLDAITTFVEGSSITMTGVTDVNTIIDQIDL